MNIADLIIILILLAGALGGYQKGFFGSLLGLFSNILAFFIALKYYPPVAQWLNGQFQLLSKIEEFLRQHITLPLPVSQLNLAQLPFAEVMQQIEEMALPSPVKDQLHLYLEAMWLSVSQGPASLGELLFSLVATALVNGLAFFAVWFVVEKAFNLLILWSSRLVQGSFLGGLNRLGGLGIGLLLSAFSLTIFLGLISPLLTLAVVAEPSFFAALFSTLGESVLIPYFTKAFSLLFSEILNLWYH